MIHCSFYSDREEYLSKLRNIQLSTLKVLGRGQIITKTARQGMSTLNSNPKQALNLKPHTNPKTPNPKL